MKNEFEIKKKHKVHVIKIAPSEFTMLGKTGIQVTKNTENFKQHDIIWFQEWTEENGFTGESKKFAINFVVGDNTEGVKTGYCVIGMEHYSPMVFRGS